MTGVFEILAHDDEENRKVAHKAAVLAKTRVENEYGRWLDSQGKPGLDYLASEIEATVRIAAAEVGGDGDQTFATVWDYFEHRLSPQDESRTASVHESRLPKMCPFHKDVVQISLTADDPRAGFDSMAQHWGGPRHCEGDGYEGSRCNFKPQMTTKAYWDERAEKLEQKRQERAERAEEESQPIEELDGTDDTATETEGQLPVSDTPVGADDEESNVIEVDFGNAEVEAPADGTEVPMSMAASTKESEYKYIKKQGDEWVIVQKGTGKVLSHHDSEEEAKAAFRAMETNMHGSKVAAPIVVDKAEPEPKMDKRKWTPQTVPFLDDVDDPDGPHPTRHQDIVEPIRATNADKPTQIGEQVTERQDVTKEVDYAKTEGQGGSWTDGPKTAVSSFDPQKNELVEIMENDYDGFLPEAEVQKAVLAYRNR